MLITSIVTALTESVCVFVVDPVDDILFPVLVDVVGKVEGLSVRLVIEDLVVDCDGTSDRKRTNIG